MGGVYRDLSTHTIGGCARDAHLAGRQAKGDK